MFSTTAIWPARSVHPKLRQTQPQPSVDIYQRRKEAGLGDVQVQRARGTGIAAVYIPVVEVLVGADADLT